MLTWLLNSPLIYWLLWLPLLLKLTVFLSLLWLFCTMVTRFTSAPVVTVFTIGLIQSLIIMIMRNIEEFLNLRSFLTLPILSVYFPSFLQLFLSLIPWFSPPFHYPLRLPLFPCSLLLNYFILSVSIYFFWGGGVFLYIRDCPKLWNVQPLFQVFLHVGAHHRGFLDGAVPRHLPAHTFIHNIQPQDRPPCHLLTLVCLSSQRHTLCCLYQDQLCHTPARYEHSVEGSSPSAHKPRNNSIQIIHCWVTSSRCVCTTNAIL